MTAKEIIMAMVEGLRNPVAKIYMQSFGTICIGVCYGCAATNAICKIMGIESNEALKEIVQPKMKGTTDFRAPLFVEAKDPLFLESFECAIDDLREANIQGYNRIAERLGIAKINDSQIHYLPYLHNDYTETDLKEYVKLAESQGN